MSVTNRDKKIIFMIIPILLIGAFYYFVMSPKRKEASKVQQELTQAQSQRDSAQAQVSQLTAAKNSFASDYQTVISLGKAVPAQVDMPSLLVQLDTAAKGTGISFDEVHLGDTSASGSTSSSGSTPPGGGSNPAAPGSAPASGGPGGAAQSAGQGVASANAKNDANASAQSSTGGTGNTASGASSSGVQGLNSIPLDFSFTGDFGNLADFFHRMKRFVQVVNGQIQVRGRLMTVDSFTFSSSASFPKLTATVKATVYLAPKAEGIAAGATPQGPAGTSTASAPSTSTAPSNSTPTAVVTR